MGTFANAVDHYYYMKKTNDTKMSFWGISSGTHLAQTIAYTWPEAVDKFFLDGSVPTHLAYTETSAQPIQLKNADRALEAFFYTCLQAPNCVFKGNSTTTAELRARYDAVDAGLKKKSLKVPGLRDFDWSILHRFLVIALQGPGWFSVLGGVLAEAEAGQPAGWIPYLLTQGPIGTPPPPRFPQLVEAAPVEGILAGVAIDEKNHIKDNNNFRHYLDGMLAAAPTVASVFAEWRLVGQKWLIETRNPFPGTFAPVDLTATGGQIVLHNNVADPAASLDSAASIAAKFTPSVIVKSAAAGHTMFTALSDCLFGIMYLFFVNGVVPDGQAPACTGIQNPPFSEPGGFSGVQLPATF
jgi:pimeloyl-ACP methyl ester carboxylesterase